MTEHRLQCRKLQADDVTICGAQAVAGLITETEEDHVHDGLGDPPVILELFPLCEAHAYDMAHRLGTTSDPEDYLFIELPPTGVGRLT